MRFAEGMTGQIRIRVSVDEKRRLIEVARKRGLSLSDFLRQTAMDASISSRVAA